ncbi:hypothetical protein K437DRAFT_259363 [Tilletiaria anomala UBC 951]|uniref:Uncharacterized protein n=1 Tax=Tilletiaria anomala (strain ATCC 24038 / CBS 436.72 / UBC 951) TaxID=1037660 RepID=A0A066VJ04_TILAU|nr:uncharacterized protein K437DRAFT_259363 [Tilletiaria anomala UBC 951]KDN38575.1 hypothetical protein K437DRAFT_259363 [Tilletiaria anomala UBC 951]
MPCVGEGLKVSDTPGFVRRRWRIMLSADHQSSPKVVVEVFGRSGERIKHRRGSISINQHFCLTCAAYIVGVHHPFNIAK